MLLMRRKLMRSVALRPNAMHACEDSRHKAYYIVWKSSLPKTFRPNRTYHSLGALQGAQRVITLGRPAVFFLLYLIALQSTPSSVKEPLTDTNAEQ